MARAPDAIAMRLELCRDEATSTRFDTIAHTLGIVEARHGFDREQRSARIACACATRL